jgi:hypothetical protein
MGIILVENFFLPHCGICFRTYLITDPFYLVASTFRNFDGGRQEGLNTDGPVSLLCVRGSTTAHAVVQDEDGHHTEEEQSQRIDSDTTAQVHAAKSPRGQ